MKRNGTLSMEVCRQVIAERRTKAQRSENFERAVWKIVKYRRRQDKQQYQSSRWQCNGLEHCNLQVKARWAHTLREGQQSDGIASLKLFVHSIFGGFGQKSVLVTAGLCFLLLALYGFCATVIIAFSIIVAFFTVNPLTMKYERWEMKFIQVL